MNIIDQAHSYGFSLIHIDFIMPALSFKEEKRETACVMYVSENK